MPTSWDDKFLNASQSDGVVYLGTPSRDSPVNFALFKALCLGATSGGGHEFRQAKCARWRIKGGYFKEVVDFMDHRRLDELPLPAMEFEECVLEKGFNAEATVTRRLRFVRCALGAHTGPYGFTVSIGLRNCQLEGDLLLENLTSLRDDKVLTLYAHEAEVYGDVRLANTIFAAPPDHRENGYDRLQYAVDLNGAKLHHDLTTGPKAELCGGLRIRRVNIGGELMLADLKINSGEGLSVPEGVDPADFVKRNCIEGSGANVAGHIFFQGYAGCKRFSANGLVNFYGLKAGGSVQLADAMFSVGSAEFAVNFTSARIGGDITCSPQTRSGHSLNLSVSGGALFSGIEIGGRLDLAGEVDSIFLNLMKVAGNTTLALRVSQTAYLEGATIGGNLDLSGFSFDYSNKNANRILSLKDANVGKSLTLSQWVSTTPLKFVECKTTMPACCPSCHLFEIYVDQGVGTILARKDKTLLLSDDSEVSSLFLKESVALDLSSDDLIRDHVRLDGAYTWLEAGPNVIIEDRKQLPIGRLDADIEKLFAQPQPMKLNVEPSDRDWTELRSEYFPYSEGSIDDSTWANYVETLKASGVWIETYWRQGHMLLPVRVFLFTREAKLGKKTMLKGSQSAFGRPGPRCELNPADLPVYSRPIIKDRKGVDSDYQPDTPWISIGEVELTLRVPNWRQLLEKRLANFQRAQVSLVNASCRVLDDADGRGWGNEGVELSLDNFAYQYINFSSPSSTRGKVPSLAGSALLMVFRKEVPLPAMGGWISTIWTREKLISDTKGQAVRDRLAWLGHGDAVPGFEPNIFGKMAIVLMAKLDENSRFARFYNRFPRVGIGIVGALRRLYFMISNSQSRSGFSHQPYTQLANVLRASGDDRSAKEIEAARIRRGVKEKAPSMRPPLWLYIPMCLLGAWSIIIVVHGSWHPVWIALSVAAFCGAIWYWYSLFWIGFALFFRYGLSPTRATCSVILCILLGWASVDAANKAGFLVRSTSSVSTSVQQEKVKGEGNHDSTIILTPVIPFVDSSSKATSLDILCGSAINGALYATDVFIPLLDLRQEGRCDVRSMSKGDLNPDKEWVAQSTEWGKITHYSWALFHSPVLWLQFAKSAYAILGWIVMSLAILTFSGVLRRWTDK